MAEIQGWETQTQAEDRGLQLLIAIWPEDRDNGTQAGVWNMRLGNTGMGLGTGL